MWFRNLVVYRLPKGWNIEADALSHALRAFAFAPATSLEESTQGWAPPFESDPALAIAIGGHLLCALRIEKKLLPAKVVSQVLRQRVEKIEEDEGFKPGRKRVRELKDAVRDELLPRAFSVSSETRVWFDPVGGWLLVDAASTQKADAVISLLVKAIDGFAARALKLEGSAASAMTQWLASGEAPGRFTVDQDAELRARQGKATIRYANQSIAADDVARHIAAGMQCTKLALTWSDRVSFVLTEKPEIRRVRALDILKESAPSLDAQADAAERFAADMALMTGELSKMLADVVEALGGDQSA